MNAAMRLPGKVSVITGATDGIGFEIARRLGMEGSAVAITGRNEDRLQSALDRLKADKVDCIGVQGHAGNKGHRESLVKATLDKFGGVDILVNCAAVNPMNSTINKIEDSKFDHLIGVNVKAPFHLTQLCFDSMKQRGGGSVVNISSVASMYPNFYPEFPLYGVTKSALNSMCEHMSAELGESNIRINTLVCGYFPTKFASIVTDNDHIRKDAFDRMCLRRGGDIKEIAAMAAHICSPEASYITGQKIAVNGGMRVR